MLKRFTAINLIALLLLLNNLSITTNAQVQNKNAVENQSSQNIITNEKPNLKEVVAKKSATTDTIESIDFKKIQKEQANSTVTKKKMSGKKKFWLTMAVIGAVVGVVLLAIYAKPCPEGQEYECETDFVTDTQDCTCVVRN